MQRAGLTALPFFLRVVILTLAGHHGKTTYSSGHVAPGYVAFLSGTSAQQNYRSRAGRVSARSQQRMAVMKPAPFVFTVAGTNGKGTTCRTLEIGADGGGL